MKRFVGLDGIKGLALIAIVLYHCMQQRLPGGFYGVDVFFTVSGFLIAVSLIRSLAKTGSLNLVRYIPKRAVRLYPALFLLIPVIVSVGWLFDHDILVSIRDQVITVLLGCYNWYAIAGGQSYFDQMNPQVFSPSVVHWRAHAVLRHRAVHRLADVEAPPDETAFTHPTGTRGVQQYRHVGDVCAQRATPPASTSAPIPTAWA